MTNHLSIQLNNNTKQLIFTNYNHNSNSKLNMDEFVLFDLNSISNMGPIINEDPYYNIVINQSNSTSSILDDSNTISTSSIQPQETPAIWTNHIQPQPTFQNSLIQLTILSQNLNNTLLFDHNKNNSHQTTISEVMQSLSTGNFEHNARTNETTRNITSENSSYKSEKEITSQKKNKKTFSEYN